MSFHQNPDGSGTEGTKVEANGTFVSHVFVAGLTSSVGIGAAVATAKAAGATQAVIQALVANVSYRLDGTAPTAAVGMQIIFGGDSLALNMTDAANALFISATGGIAVSFTM
jgi:hypothetical protein